MAVQIARARGAEVFATASPSQLEVVERLGATPIDYTTTAVDEYVAKHTGGEGFDAIFDTVGGPVLDASFAAARTYTGPCSCAQALFQARPQFRARPSVARSGLSPPRIGGLEVFDVRLDTAALGKVAAVNAENVPRKNHLWRSWLLEL